MNALAELIALLIGAVIALVVVAAIEERRAQWEAANG